jgi:hypothetical protein
MKKLLFIAIIAFNVSLSHAQNSSDTTLTTQRFRIAVNGGFSRRLAKTADDVPANLKQYVNQLKSGYNIESDISYLFDDWGVGIKYTIFKASNSISNVSVRDINGNTRTGNLADDISINFIGPSVSTKYSSKNLKHIFLFSAALGYMTYKNNAVIIDPYKITSSTFGSSLDANYDFKVIDKLYLGAHISFNGGTLKSITFDNGQVIKRELEKNEYESLTRIDLSLGLRFIL